MGLFGGYTNDEIAGEVQKQIKYFDDQVNEMHNLMSFNLDHYPKLYTMSTDISIGISGVCVAIAVIYAYMAIVKKGLSLKGDWKEIVAILLRLSISKGLIDTATQFMTWLYAFYTKVSDLTIVAVQKEHDTKSLNDLFKQADILKGLNINEKSSLIDRLFAMQYAKFLGFAFFALTIVLIIVFLARMLKIYVLLSFAAVAFAKIPMYGWDGCKEYVKEMCALALQGGIIMASIGLFQVASTIIPDLIKTESTWGAFGGIIVLAISMILLVFKSEEIARKVV